MKTKQQIIADLADRLSQKMPCCYHNISPLLSTHLMSINYTPLEMSTFSIGEMDTIMNAAAQSHDAYNRLLDVLVEITRRNMKQMITLAYFNMSQGQNNASESDWYLKLKHIIDTARQPGFPVIIASYGVDLDTLSQNSKYLRQQEGSWYLSNDRIYELDLLQNSPKQDSTFFVLSKRDAPFFDFCGQYEKPYTVPTGGLITQDVYNSIGLFTKRDIASLQEHLMVKSLIPLLYQPQKNLFALKVKINYDAI